VEEKEEEDELVVPLEHAHTQEPKQLGIREGEE